MDFETELRQVAEEYRAEGYEVVVRPQSAQLPAFAAHFHADLLARKNGENVLVQVKQNREDLRKDPDTPQMAEVVNAQPGWRFDLVVLNRNVEPEKIAKDASEPPAEHLLRNLDNAERAARAGEVTSACLVAWAALEAAMRHAARAAGLQVSTWSPQFLLGSLYTNGLLDRNEYDELNHHLRVRNAVAHGLEVPQMDRGLPLSIASAARKLLALNGQEQPA